MTDLVKLLRLGTEHNWADATMAQAANEIERLREALGRLLSLAEVADVMDEPGRPTVKLARKALENKS